MALGWNTGILVTSGHITQWITPEILLWSLKISLKDSFICHGRLTWKCECDLATPLAVLIKAVCGVCLLEIFAQSWPGIKGLSSGSQENSGLIPLHVPPQGTSVWRLCLCGDPSGSLYVCVRLHMHCDMGLLMVCVIVWERCRVCANALATLPSASKWSPWSLHFIILHGTCNAQGTSHASKHITDMFRTLFFQSAGAYYREGHSFFAITPAKTGSGLRVWSQAVWISGCLGGLAGVKAGWVLVNCAQVLQVLLCKCVTENDGTCVEQELVMWTQW